MPFAAYACKGEELRAGIEPATRCIVSWSAAQAVDIDLRVQVADGRKSDWLPYVRRDPWRSCSSQGELAHIEVDVVTAPSAMIAIEIRARGLDGIFLATPPRPAAVSPSVRALTRMAIPSELQVPAYSQYVGDERGWCAAASLAMVLSYWAYKTGDLNLLSDAKSTAAAIYDDAYGGTGNWTFGAAYANMRGLRGAVAYLRDLDHAERFVLANIPLIVSICWQAGELDGAPLTESAGHLLVVRGFDREGYVVVSDPALPGVAGRYRRGQLEAAWQRAGGVCYAIAPRTNADLLNLLAG